MEEQSSCTVGSWPLSQQNKAGEGGGGWEMSIKVEVET